MSMWDDLFSEDPGYTSWFNQAIVPADTGTDLSFGGGGNQGFTVDPAAFYSDILEATDITFGGNFPSWVSGDDDFKKLFSAFSSGSSAGAATAAPKTAEAAKTTVDKGGETSSAKGGGLLGRATSWINENKALSEMLGRGVQAVAAGKAAKDAAKTTARSRIEELNRADELKQADNARVSASVTGLRTPTNATGGLLALAKRRQESLKNITGRP